MSNLKIFLIIVFLNYVSNVQSFNITIIHNNDFHSHFAPVNAYSSPCDKNSVKNGKCFGGVARIVSKVKEIKASNKNSLFLNAGDNFQGTAWYTLYKWKVVEHFVKLLKYDAMAIGNHEFDDGIDGFAPYLNATNAYTPTLCANLDATNEPKIKDKFNKSMVIKVEKQKIGIIGYITPETSFLASPGKTVTFMDEIESIKKEVELMKKEGINIIIGLGHSGFTKDIEIATKVPDIDIIVGGHSHSLLWNGPKPANEEVVDKYPTVVNHGSHKTLIVQAFAFSKYLGKIDLEFDENGYIINYDGQPILLDNTVKEDPEVAKDIDRYEVMIESKYSEPIGNTYVLLEGGNRCMIGECSLGNLITDAMVEYHARKRTSPTEGWTEAAIAVYNGGGLRSTIDELSNNGSITFESLISVLPFQNNLITLIMSGQILEEMLEFSATKYDHTLKMGNGRFLQVSGIRVVYNMDKPEMQRVESVAVRCADCRVPEFKALNHTQQYRVIVPQYLADGGDGYAVLKQKEVQKISDEVLDNQIVSQFITHKSPIIHGLENRITLKHKS